MDMHSIVIAWHNITLAFHVNYGNFMTFVVAPLKEPL